MPLQGDSDGYNRPEGGWRYDFRGIKTNASPDELQPNKFPYAQNVRKVKSLQTRPGYVILPGFGGTGIVNRVTIQTICPLPIGQNGIPYSVTLVALLGTPPYTWAVTSGALPTGLTLDTFTGIISGTPSALGTFTFTFQVTDSNGGAFSKTCQMTVQSSCFDFADNFNRADGPLGANWLWTSEGSGHQADVVSNQFADSALGTAEVVAAPDTNTNGYSEVTWSGYTSIAWGGPMALRKVVGINNNRYLLRVQDLGGGEPRAQVDLVRFVTGASSIMATATVNLVGFAFGNPLRLSFNVQPTKITLTGFVNGTQVWTADDLAGDRQTTGKPGISIFTSAGGTANSWDNYSCHTCP